MKGFAFTTVSAIGASQAVFWTWDATLGQPGFAMSAAIGLVSGLAALARAARKGWV